MTYLRWARPGAWVFLGLAGLILVCGCKKHNSNSPGSVDSTSAPALIGSWNWVLAVKLDVIPGPGDSMTPASTGMQQTLTFGSNGLYELIQGNTNLNHGFWSIKPEPTLDGTFPFLVLTRAGGMDSIMDHEIYNDTLWMAYTLEDSTSSYAWYYVKIPPPPADPF